MSSPSPAASVRAHAGLFLTPANAGERLVALALALLLLRSAFAHLGNPYHFLSTVYSYQLVRIEAGKWVALVLPYLQMVVAVCLLARWWPKQSYLLAFVLFAAFVVAQAMALRQGLEISCGCFGAAESLQVGWATLTVASSAAAASLLGWLLTAVRDRKSRTAPSGGSNP